MMIREPAQAGRFYPGDETSSRRMVEELLLPSDQGRGTGGQIVGGIVPHAGWLYSGAVAGEVFATIAAQRKPATVVLFGAAHYKRGQVAWLFGSGQWRTPMGPIEVDDRLAGSILRQTGLIVDDPYAHAGEHSLEVQLPLLLRSLPGCQIVPVLVPPTAAAPEVGHAVARAIVACGIDAVIVGSTDLTHYGPAYGRIEHGVGAAGVRWARQVSDRRMIDLMLRLDADQVVPEAAGSLNACGAGAIAATLAAAQQMGATRGVLLRHTCSADVIGDPEASDSVGYAGMIFLGDTHPEGWTQ